MLVFRGKTNIDTGKAAYEYTVPQSTVAVSCIGRNLGAAPAAPIWEPENPEITVL